MNDNTEFFYFRGSFIDGPEIDVLSWAGINLTDEQHDKVFGATNIEDIVRDCRSAELQVVDVFEGEMPGASDTFYEVTSDNKELFKRELRDEIERLLQT